MLSDDERAAAEAVKALGWRPQPDDKVWIRCRDFEYGVPLGWAPGKVVVEVPRNGRPVAYWRVETYVNAIEVRLTHLLPRDEVC